MPERSIASTPMSRKPAWAIDEYASIRLTSVCTMAITEPTIIVRIATPHIIGIQSHRIPYAAT